LVLYNPSPQDP